MAKGKDLNDAGVEASKTGNVVPLRIVDIDDILLTSIDPLAEMNKKHAFINTVGGKPMIMCDIYNEVYDKEIIEFRSPDAIMMQYCNQNAPGGKNGDTPTPLGKWWVAHPDRREYDTVTFEPTKEPGPYLNEKINKQYFNLWEGFTEIPTPGSWKRTLKHIYKVLCNKDREKYYYTIQWIAWCIQNPGIRAEVAIVFKGKKGAGKGFIFTQLVKLFGRHGMSISNGEHLTGKHNAHLMMLSFLFADEAYYPGDKGIEGALKQLITEPNLTVEPKFQNTRLSVNCLHVGMSTNNDWVIPASDDERRFFINEVDSKFAKNQTSDAARKEYFSKLWGEMEHGGRAAMLYDLQKMNLKDWHPRDDIPDTEELKRQKDLSMPKREKAILAFLENGIFPGVLVGKFNYQVGSTELNDYMERLEPGSARISIKHKAALLKELGAVSKVEHGQRVWVFPPLEQIKTNWNQIKGMHNWEDYNGWELQKQTPLSTI